MKHLVYALALGLLAAPLAAQERPWGEAERRADALHALVAAGPQSEDLLRPARAAFSAASARPCPGARPLVVVLPVQADGGTMAYFLSRPLQPSQLITGGAWRVAIAADGSVGMPEQLAGECRTIAWDAGDDELQLGVGYIQRAGAAMPSEFDLLLSKEAPFPLGIVAAPHVWPLIAGRTDGPVDADPEMFAEE